MRGVCKGQPPTNVAPPGRPPMSLLTAHHALRTQLAAMPASAHKGHARDTFDGLHKPHLRASLRDEQRHLCVYCEGAVPEVFPFPPVDHWEPIDQAPIRALDWDNLHLSCSSELHCDETKKNAQLGLPVPSALAYERCLGIGSDGTVYVRTHAPLSPADRAALERAIGEEILNLNADTLVAARKAAMDVEREQLAKKGRTNVPQSDRDHRATRLLDAPRRLAYVSARVAYLTRTLGQDRPPPPP
jgi:uncharacterized protein (TIGR02646 family)